MNQDGLIDRKGNPINKQKHGGPRASFLTHFLVLAVNIAMIPNILNTVTYLHETMYFDLAQASTTMTNFLGVTSLFALLGGFLSDSYIKRFTMILIFGPLEFLGYGMLAIQAHFGSLRPPQCDIGNEKSNCSPVQGGKAAMLYIALYTVALGEGCLRANIPSFGGDQFDENDIEESKQRSSFFNWYTFSISLGGAIGLVLIISLESSKGWDYGFAACSLVILVGWLVLVSGFPLYRHQSPSGSPLARIMQVTVVALKNRKLDLPENAEELNHGETKEDMVGVEVLSHTNDFKFLDKASILTSKKGKLSPCSVTQVEETKIIFRLVPIALSSIICYVPVTLLLTLTVQQGNTMNKKVGRIHISPASLFFIPITFQMLILFLYDRFIMPFGRRLIKDGSGITSLKRVGLGYFTTTISMCLAAMIEKKRKQVAIEHGMVEATTGIPMSVLWLGFQFFVLGIFDATSFVGLLEFFNSEVSKGMKSLGTAIFWCILGLGSLLGSFLVHLVNQFTRHSQGEGWLGGNNLNKNHLDRFYWLLALIGFISFINYLWWALQYSSRQFYTRV
ncbi:hypothetical protein AMTR_s00089p00178270 [Amborella trichopoda]|uniref:Major facilitator superfamily (MFS) profile domain-containing protein n=1 Tax=Amborella trichopoda TaxID=13333 RepID=W1P4M6_AMBTC|nr:hypothetical protein AMTR_s00089p00178270 [Amborella trichopoda]